MFNRKSGSYLGKSATNTSTHTGIGINSNLDSEDQQLVEDYTNQL